MRASLMPVVICLCLLGGINVARAEDPVTSAQSVIESQIVAMLHNDADSAYSFASPAIRAVYPDKDKFFDMVKKSYAPVYHPGNYAFGRNKTLGGGAVVLQEVLITGTEGKDWTAVYKIEKQEDGTYKVAGVQIVANTASQGI